MDAGKYLSPEKNCSNTPKYSTTPIKNFCILCCTSYNKLISLDNNKARREHHLEVLNSYLNLELCYPDASNLYVCEQCLQKVLEFKRKQLEFEEFKKCVASNKSKIDRMARGKRGPRTPLASERNKKRATVVEQMFIKKGEINPKKLAFQSSEETVKSSSVQKDIFKQALFKDIRDQLSELATRRKENGSILYKTDFDSINDEQFFFKVVKEMESRIPILKEILEICLGDSHEEIPTIATIYGMIMHSQDNHAVAVQKLYTCVGMATNISSKVRMRLLISFFLLSFMNSVFSTFQYQFTFVQNVFISLIFFNC